MILVAGGSGITASLSWLLDSAQKMKNGIGILSSVKLLWMVQSKDHIECASSEFKAAKTLVGDNQIEIDIYVTRASADDIHLRDHELGKEKQEASGSVASTSSQSFASTSLTTYTFHSGRPFIPDVLPKMLSPDRNIIIGTVPYILL